jgi:hypothetical protein
MRNLQRQGVDWLEGRMKVTCTETLDLPDMAVRIRIPRICILTEQDSNL